MKIIATKKYLIIKAQAFTRSGSFDDVIYIYSNKLGGNKPYNVVVVYDFTPPFFDKDEPKITIVRIINKINGKDIIQYVDNRTIQSLKETVKSSEWKKNKI